MSLQRTGLKWGNYPNLGVFRLASGAHPQYWRSIINALRLGSWAVIGWLVCGLLCLAQSSHGRSAPSTANDEANPDAGIAPIQLVLSDSLGAVGIFENRASHDPLVLEIPRPSLERMAYLTGLLIVLILMLAWHWWDFLRNKRGGSALATTVPGEQRSPELVSLVRTALVPKFNEWLNSRAVQQLIAQRDGLRGAQEVAEAELAKLEQILIEVHAPLHERIRGYEQRIAELEEALEAKGDAGRELIETMIHLTRQRLESEQEANPEPAAT